MLNYIWAGMILIGVLYASLTGNMEELTNGILDSSKEAVSLCIVMLGVVSMWSGIMEIAARSGIIEGMTRRIYPVVRFMFPKVPKGHEVEKYISTNIIANIMGLGWAATPAGLKAMEALGKLQEERGIDKKRRHIASNEMCTFLIINISSLQLIPVNMIAYRSQYGSANPAIIVGPAILATMISTIVAIIFCKLLSRR